MAIAAQLRALDPIGASGCRSKMNRNAHAGIRILRDPQRHHLEGVDHIQRGNVSDDGLVDRDHDIRVLQDYVVQAVRIGVLELGILGDQPQRVVC